MQRLARERHFLENLFNAIEDGVLVIDETGRILYFNEAVTRLIGLPAQGTEGQPLTRFLPELDWEMWCGPAPLRPFARGIHPRGFRSYLDYANGTLGDWGVHWMDQILWIMDLIYRRWNHSAMRFRIYDRGT